MNTTKIQSLQGRIEKVKESLAALGDMRPGSLSKQYNVCGNPTCRCKDPENPRKHGPYYQVSYTHRGKSTTAFVRKEVVSEAKMELRNYRRFKKLTEKWIELSLEIVKTKREQAR